MRLNVGANIKEHELIEARKRLRRCGTSRSEEKRIKAKSSSKTSYKSGDEVKVLRYGQKGTLIEKVSDTEWIVQIGILKMKMDQSGLEYVKPEKEKTNSCIDFYKRKRFLCETGT